MRRDCRDILRSAIAAVDPRAAVQRHVVVPENSNGDVSITIGGRQYYPKDYDTILLVGFGKASSAMAAAVVEQLQQASCADRVRGIILVKNDHATPAEERLLQEHHVVLRPAGHPVPDQRSVEASEELLALVSGSQEEAAEGETHPSSRSRRLVICCISGGGSALFCAPRPPLSLQDLQTTNQVLLQSGWPITDMNVVRKKLEKGKGGRLAQAVMQHNSQNDLVSLILSDVLGDPLDLIASGPTVPDQSTYRDAWALVTRRLPETLRNTLPEAVMDVLRRGNEGTLEDSPQVPDSLLEQCHNVLIGNNEAAVMAAADKAKEKGYHPVVLGTQMVGEASHVARTLVNIAQHVRCGPGQYSLAHPPAALICGGETTVVLPADCTGKGGRNQEMALVAAQSMKEMGLRQVVFSSIGTDGTDGPTDAAGAIVDGTTVDRLPGNAVQAIQDHDAYTYLSQTDADGLSPLIKTGPTGTNVADVAVILIDSKKV